MENKIVKFNNTKPFWVIVSNYEGAGNGLIDIYDDGEGTQVFVSFKDVKDVPELLTLARKKLDVYNRTNRTHF